MERIAEELRRACACGTLEELLAELPAEPEGPEPLVMKSAR